VPEGRGRTERGSKVTFTANFDGEQIVTQRPRDPKATVRALFREFCVPARKCAKYAALALFGLGPSGEEDASESP
jgi:hypothetical protein